MRDFGKISMLEMLQLTISPNKNIIAGFEPFRY
jgi:hypothetical protein